MSLSADSVREYLSYDPATGVFVWLLRPGGSRANKIFNSKYAGQEAGCVCPRGYRYIKIEQAFYSASRLAWLYVHGDMPAKEVDHIDGNPSNNRISNLREASRSENGANRGLHRNSKSGVKGVHPDRTKTKWVAQLTWQGTVHRLGTFGSKERAAEAYADAARRIHGEFARLA